ncbi:MAG: YraN family protein [Candidatus Levybacteria bacterium]|nr:YraN family protein [Candidatus Levybacteria bacterium]
MSDYNIRLGKIGEDLATQHILRNGFSIIEKNFRWRGGEIDLIAQKNGKLHFIEIKTRVGFSRGMPYEAVTPRKLAHLKRSIELYLKKNNLAEMVLSLDIISIILNNKRQVERFDFYENIEA